MSDTIQKPESLILEIKKSIKDFNEAELLDYTKYAIQNLHYFFCNDRFDKIKKYCSKDVIEKIINQKDKFRITNNIDRVNIQYMRISDTYTKDDICYIKLYVSIIFFDDVSNNPDFDELEATGTDYIDPNYYWNDIWEITFKENLHQGLVPQIKCPNCGASMDYNKDTKTLTCNYCRNHMLVTQINWKIVDIDVK